MPENETLSHDGRLASRWRPLREKIDAGLAPTEALPEIERQFCVSLKNVWRQWRDLGVDPNELLNAALRNPVKLGELIRQAKNDANARLLRDVARTLPNADMESLIAAFLDAAWHSARSQLQLQCREEQLSWEFLDTINGMLDRISQSLLKNPSRFNARVGRRKPAPDIGTRLGESLL